MLDVNQVLATAVIPAYNEAHHIERVLDPLSHVPQLKQIIVVDDGSVDDTAVVVEAYRAKDERVRLLRLERNRGKGGAVMAGIQASTTDVVVLLDADLINLRAAHISALMGPVQQHRCAMTLGIFRNGRQRTNVSHRYFYFLSGQRCLRWSAFHHTAALRDARWGIEMGLNLVARQQKLPVQQVPWEGVTHMMRLEKMSGPRKYWTYAEMWADILKISASYSLKLWAANGRSPKWVRQFARRPSS